MDEEILCLLEALGKERRGILGNEDKFQKQIAEMGASAFQPLVEVLNDRRMFGSFNPGSPPAERALALRGLNIRHGAFKALCELGDKHTVALLIGFYEEKGFYEEHAIRLLDALARIANATAVDFLVREIKRLSGGLRPIALKEEYRLDSEESNRRSSLYFLGKRAVKALESILKNDLPNVSPQALRSIVQIETRILPCWFHSEDEGWVEHTVDCSPVKQLAEQSLRG